MNESDITVDELFEGSGSDAAAADKPKADKPKATRKPRAKKPAEPKPASEPIDTAVRVRALDWECECGNTNTHDLMRCGKCAAHRYRRHRPVRAGMNESDITVDELFEGSGSDAAAADKPKADKPKATRTVRVRALEWECECGNTNTHDLMRCGQCAAHRYR